MVRGRSAATDYRAKAQQLLDRIASSNSAELAKLGFATIRPFQALRLGCVLCCTVQLRLGCFCAGWRGSVGGEGERVAHQISLACRNHLHSFGCQTRDTARLLHCVQASPQFVSVGYSGACDALSLEVGVTKVFLKDPLMQLLENKLTEKLRASL